MSGEKTHADAPERSSPPAVEELVQAVQSSPRYRHMAPGLIRRIGAQELAKGRGWKEALKATKNKLHQVGGAYFSSQPAYTRWEQRLDVALSNPGSPLQSSDREPDLLESRLVRAFCLDAMRQHASTRERLPVLETFFERTLESIAPVHSILDLACGLNPLAIPWMPRAPDFTYRACDIYADLVAFLNSFFTRLGVHGSARVCDLISEGLPEPVQVAYLLKTVPCLEQVDKQAGLRILEAVQADHVLVSFPAHSLGGRDRGMPENYSERFQELLEGKSWRVQEYHFPSEVAFLVTKGSR